MDYSIDFDAITAFNYEDTSVILLCYSCDDRKSFENVEVKWIKHCRRFAPLVPIVLVSTKVDLRSDNSDNKNNNDAIVTREEGEALAKRINATSLVEVTNKSSNKNKSIERLVQVAMAAHYAYESDVLESLQVKQAHVKKWSKIYGSANSGDNKCMVQ